MQVRDPLVGIHHREGGPFRVDRRDIGLDDGATVRGQRCNLGVDVADTVVGFDAELGEGSCTDVDIALVFEDLQEKAYRSTVLTKGSRADGRDHLRVVADMGAQHFRVGEARTDADGVDAGARKVLTGGAHHADGEKPRDTRIDAVPCGHQRSGFCAIPYGGGIDERPQLYEALHSAAQVDDTLRLEVTMDKLGSHPPDVMNHNLADDRTQVTIDKAREAEKEINLQRDVLRKDHLKSMEQGDYHIKSGMVYSDLYSSCEKIGDHIINVTEAIMGKV